MAILVLSGNNVAFFDGINDSGGNVSIDATFAFLSTDIVTVTVPDGDIQANGEFDYSEVYITRFAVERAGVEYVFNVGSGVKIKESGASDSSSSGAKEQGDDFFTTTDVIGSPSTGPFSGLSSGTVAFAANNTFTSNSTTTLVHVEDLDLNNDGDTNDTVPLEAGNGNFNINSIVCFTSGTLITTQSGEVAIEKLSAGDMVLTMDHGYQPIRWIGSSKRIAMGDLAPILIRKDTLGNTRDLRVSPQHRMLIQGSNAELLFGEAQVLVAAKSLINDNSIIRVEGGTVEYFHMMFDAHEIIFAEGALTESFYPAQQGWAAMDQAARDEILEVFPQFADNDFESHGSMARQGLKHNEGVLLGELLSV